MTPDLAGQLLDRIQADTGDWYEALYMVALDETGDPAEAMALADEALTPGDPAEGGE